MWKLRWPPWAPIRNKPMVSVDIKQRSTKDPDNELWSCVKREVEVSSCSPPPHPSLINCLVSTGVKQHWRRRLGYCGTQTHFDGNGISKCLLVIVNLEVCVPDAEIQTWNESIDLLSKPGEVDIFWMSSFITFGKVVDFNSQNKSYNWCVPNNQSCALWQWDS